MTLIFFDEPERLFYLFELDAQLRRADRVAFAELQRLQHDLSETGTAVELAEKAVWGADIDGLELHAEPTTVRVSCNGGGVVIDTTYEFDGNPQLWLFWPGVTPAAVIYGEVEYCHVRLFGMGESEEDARLDLVRNEQLARRYSDEQRRHLRVHRHVLLQHLAEAARDTMFAQLN